MRTVDPNDDLQDGLEPSVSPPMAADGGLQFSPIRDPLPQRPRLCEAGPCKNYHQLSVQMDAARPHTRRLPIVLPEGTPGAAVIQGGTAYTSPATYHVQVSHYCYPTSGVEMILGDLPVTKCNRWAPLGPQRDSEGSPLSISPRDFLRTPAGQMFEADVRNWERARAEEASEADEAERLIEESMKIHETTKETT